MFTNTHRLSGVVFLTCVLPAIVGCQIVEKHCCPEGEQILGTVTTGGPYAIPTALPIPLEGLTLGDAVERTLRPGLVSEDAPRGYFTSAPNQDVPPVADQKLTSRQKITTPLQLLARGAATIPVTAERIAKLGDGSETTERIVAAQLAQAQANNLFDINATPQNGATLEQLVDDLARTVGVTLAETPDDATPSAGAAANPGSAGDSAADPEPDPPVTDPPETSSPSDSELTVLPSQTRTGPIAVHLTRRTGDRIIVPLEMVQNYAPADIWLTDGDRVQVLPLTMTEAGETLPGQSATPVSSFPAPQSSGVDLLILVHSSVLDGKKEQYYLPATNPHYYGSAAFVKQWQQNTYVHPGDDVLAGTMELSPVIRTSRNNLIAASAAALEERVNPPVKWKQNLHRSVEKSKNKLKALPGISHVRNGIEQQIGPVSLHGSVKQTTGFDREEFCRKLNP